MTNILVAIPIKPSLNKTLLDKCLSNAFAMQSANPDIEFTFHFDFSKIEKLPTDKTPWSRVARARNLILENINLKNFDYVLWIDADVVDYPPDMPTKLIECNTDGVTAPFVLVEGTKRFYDWSAFILLGQSKVRPDERGFIKGRNVSPDEPYFPFNYQGWKCVPLDGVGTITLVPTWIYEKTRYTDHPAFTDHFDICQACIKAGFKVMTNTEVIAYHADLPKYGESWH